MKPSVEYMVAGGNAKLVCVVHFDTMNRKVELLCLAVKRDADRSYRYVIYSDAFSSIGSTYQNCGTTVPDNELDDHIIAYAIYTMKQSGLLTISGSCMEIRL